MLDFCTGRGRNTAALRAAGFDVVAVADNDADRFDLRDDDGTFVAAISTHGFLHGTSKTIAQRLDRVARRLSHGGVLYATFGSVRDARFGRGLQLDPATFAPQDGDEAGIAHTYFTRAQLEDLLWRSFTVERLWEGDVDAIAGSWAHPTQPLSHAVHWFAVACRVSTTSSSGLDALA